MSNPERNPRRLIDKKEFAALIGIKPGTLSNWLTYGTNDIPKGIKLGTGQSSPRRWRMSEAEAWVEAWVNKMEQSAA